MSSPSSAQSPIVPSRPQGSAWGARFKAAAIHLGLSGLVAALAAGLVFGLWYPTPFREISGGRELFFIVVAVDVVLGPLITFAVFDRRKPRAELRRDLAIVALLQLSGLAYGLHTVFVARPAVLALEADRLRVVTAVDLDEAALAKAPPGLRSLPWRGALVVAARKATDAERLDVIEQALAGRDVGQRPEFWLPAAATGAAMVAAGKPLADLIAHYPDRRAELTGWIGRTGRTADQLKYLPMLARRTDWVALIDARDGAIAGYAPFDGF